MIGLIKTFKNSKFKSIILFLNFRVLKKTILSIILISYTFLYGLEVQAFESKEIVKLEEKIAKSYSNKFCNSIGIGLSTDSAIKITISENSNLKYNPAIWLDIAFNGENKLNELDETSLTEKIYSNISLECGNAINNLNKDRISALKDSLKNIKIH